MSEDDCNYIIHNGPIPLGKWKNCKSLGEIFLQRLEELGDSELLIDAITSNVYTASEIRIRSIQMAKCLQNFGLSRGDTISIYSENRIEFVYLLLASIYLGISLGLTFVDYTDEEFKNTVVLLQPRIIFSSPSIEQKIVKLARINNVEKVVIFDKKSNFDFDDVVPYDEFIENFNKKDVENFELESVDMWNLVAGIIRTSGTTSSAKSVQLTQRNLLCSMLEYKNRQITPIPLIVSSLPWVRPFGFRLLIRQMMHNLKMIFLPEFEEISFLQTIETYKPNTINLYTTTLHFLAHCPLTLDYDLSSIKVLFSCSAALEQRLKDAVFKKFKIPVIQQGYGMSELSSISDQNDEFHKEGSVGVLRKGIYGKVKDIKTGQILGPNKPGELLFKGENVMKGYLHNEIATKSVIDENGWLHTGDYGYFDDDHEWYLIDRLKDLIQCKNYTILPAEIERIVKQHPKVDDAGVIGIRSCDVNELPFAFVIKNDDQLSATEIIDFVASNSPPEKQIYGVRFIDKIPGDGIGKPSRLLLRKMARDNGIHF